MILLNKSLVALTATMILSDPQVAPAAEKSVTPSFLPETVWAAPGIECNIYFNNLALPHPEALFWDVSCDKGRQMQGRWTWTPEPAEAGLLPLELAGFDSDDQRAAQGKTTIRVADAKAGAGQNVRALVIGDSLTAGGHYTRELLKLFEGPDQPALTLLGTRGEGTNRHEGYPGWTWRRFLNPTSANDPPSPFLFEGKPDFSEYVRRHCEGTPPEFILIFLGTNDVFGLTDASRAAAIDKVLADAEQMVGLIRSGAEKSKIGLILPLPPASQEAFGANYGCGETRRNYFQSVKQYISAMQRQFGGREKDGIYLVPAHLGFDGEHGYPTEQQPAHARSDDTILRQVNALHPAVPGYRQVADALYAWMKNML